VLKGKKKVLEGVTEELRGEKKALGGGKEVQKGKEVLRENGAKRCKECAMRRN